MISWFVFYINWPKFGGLVLSIFQRDMLNIFPVGWLIDKQWRYERLKCAFLPLGFQCDSLPNELFLLPTTVIQINYHLGTCKLSLLWLET
jgi:hypothetical protein